MKTVITIARQLGSGGSYVGRVIASRLGFRYADREILARASQKLKLGEVELSLREERAKSYWDEILEVFALGPVEAGYTPPPLQRVADEAIFAEESRIMQALAERHDCVIIGRGGGHLFKDHPRSVHVLLHAPLSFRIARVMQVYGASNEEEAHRMIADSDRNRIAFHAKIVRDDPAKATNYHLCVDTSAVALERTADLIVDYFSEKTGTGKTGKKLAVRPVVPHTAS